MRNIARPERSRSSRSQSSQLVNETPRPPYYDSLLAHYCDMQKHSGDERLALMLEAAVDVTRRDIQMSDDQRERYTAVLEQIRKDLLPGT